nr:MAG TPA: hypothetical protein [Caudoviricetes sp.]
MCFFFRVCAHGRCRVHPRNAEKPTPGGMGARSPAEKPVRISEKTKKKYGYSLDMRLLLCYDGFNT